MARGKDWEQTSVKVTSSRKGMIYEALIQTGQPALSLTQLPLPAPRAIHKLIETRASAPPIMCAET